MARVGTWVEVLPAQNLAEREQEEKRAVRNGSKHGNSETRLWRSCSMRRHNVSHAESMEVFKLFWSLTDVKDKRVFLSKCVIKIEFQAMGKTANQWILAATLSFALHGALSVFTRKLDRVVCGYDATAAARKGLAKFLIQNMSVIHCTDIYYDSAPIDSFPVDFRVDIRYQNWFLGQDEPTPPYAAFNDHKWKHPNLVSFLVLSEEDMDMQDMLEKPSVELPGLRPGLTFMQLIHDLDGLRRFSEWAVYFLRLWRFDGLAVRWPLSAGPGRLEMFLAVLRAQMKNEEKTWRNRRESHLRLRRLQLAVLLDTNNGTLLRTYDMRRISDLANQITLEAVKDKKTTTRVTRLVQPLFYRNSQSSGDDRLTIDEAITYVVQTGVTRSKVNVAISLVGLRFQLINGSNNGIGAQTVPSFVFSGKGVDTEILYYETCRLPNASAKIRASSLDLSPYWHSGKEWVSFEDMESILQKIEYLQNASIGGIALFSQSEDDFSGTFCNNGSFPLTKAAFENSAYRRIKEQLLPWKYYCISRASVYNMLPRYSIMIFAVGKLLERI
ncbi:hypothetical protein PoB_003487800 [Plakobranchus ocellatus]|uniref:GH18 domain-containing protein n=1 Tax=Plakobranchus ocellatus TaxID=259542 RepID=A0AAV4ANL1_9GAST|nr:hypothetical protein PoB_003487800 [Plakobranchus ocellatus]